MCVCDCVCKCFTSRRDALTYGRLMSGEHKVGHLELRIRGDRIVRLPEERDVLQLVSPLEKKITNIKKRAVSESLNKSSAYSCRC